MQNAYLHSGAVMSIDTMNYAKVNYLELDATYSEGICIGKDNKVYVCNSGNTDDTQAGEGTTISVLPAAKCLGIALCPVFSSSYCFI